MWWGLFGIYISFCLDHMFSCVDRVLLSFVILLCLDRPFFCLGRPFFCFYLVSLSVFVTLSVVDVSFSLV